MSSSSDSSDATKPAAAGPSQQTDDTAAQGSQVPDLQSRAVDLVCRTAQVDADKARDVVAKAAEDHPACQDYRELAEEACLLLVVQTETIQDERDGWQQMDEAREASLLEVERAASVKPPVAEWPHAEILERHSSGHYTSCILQELQESTAKDCLWQAPMRASLVELLEVERNARKWYATCPGTSVYFERLAKECRMQVDDSNTSQQSQGRKGVKRKADPPMPDSNDAAPEPAPDPALQGRVQAAATFMHEKAQELLVLLSKMPTTPGETPDCFRELDSPMEDDGSILDISILAPQECVDNGQGHVLLG